MLETTSIAAAWFLAWLFALASWHKLRSPRDYAPLIQRQAPAWVPLVRRPGGARVLAVGLGLTELVAAAALLVPAARPAGAILAVILLLTYALSMSRMLALGIGSTRCGCGGLSSSLTHSWGLVARNVICAGLAGLVLASNAAPSLLGCAFAALLVCSYLCIEQLIGNAQAMQAAR